MADQGLHTPPKVVKWGLLETEGILPRHIPSNSKLHGQSNNMARQSLTYKDS